MLHENCACKPEPPDEYGEDTILAAVRGFEAQIGAPPAPKVFERTTAEVRGGGR